MTRNPCLFLVGCPRSGTTLLQRMLDHHPELAVANDPHFIHEVARLEGAAGDFPLTPEVVEHVLGYRTFSRLRLPEGAVRTAASGAGTFAEFVGRIYDVYASLNGKPLAGEKTGRYVRFIPLLDELFPWTKIVHLIRDGRDVALSVLQWANEDRGPGKLALWREEPVAVCALYWRLHVTAGRRDGRGLGQARYQEARYEDLVARPEAALRALTKFLALPFASEMLGFSEGRLRTEPGLSAKKAWFPPTSGLRDWRHEMDARDLELFEALAGDQLEELGYERATTRIPPAIASVADRCRVEWEAEMARRAAKRARLREAHAAEVRPVS